MSKKNKKNKNESRSTAVECLSYRTLSVRADKNGVPTTVDEKNRSIEVIAATEDPVGVFDFERYDIVNEVLLMSGVELPQSRQVPLLDTHRRFDTSSVLGSIRGLAPENDLLVGRAHFSAVPEVEPSWQKVREGHLTDFSVGYKPIDSQWIPEGESYNFNGRTFNGPLRITKKWKIREVSLVPIGADELAKARESIKSIPAKSQKSNEQTRGENKMLIDKTERDQIRTEERNRVSEISAMGRHSGCEDIAARHIEAGSSIDAARKEIFEKMTESDPGAAVGHRGVHTITHDEVEKRSEATVDGLVLRAGVPLENPAAGSDEYRVLSLVDVAKECLMSKGENVRGLSKNRLIQNALQQRAAVTGDFPYILANTANKTLRTSYDLTPSTFELWVNQTDAADFKEMSRNALSEAPALEEVPEHGEYRYGKFGESKEVFQVVKKGKIFAITREALINDDLGAFTSFPQAFAASAKRGVNEAAYAALTANAAMADGTALFHADHSNYVGTGSGAAPDETTLTAARLAMRVQTGLNGALLNISPQFLIVPAALETTADKLLNSLGDLADDKSSGVVNPFYKKLVPVVESYLDANSSTAWYLAANPKMIDTVEIAFLGGNKKPYLESKEGWSVDGTEYKVRFEYGVKSIDWRGLYCNEGA